MKEPCSKICKIGRNIANVSSYLFTFAPYLQRKEEFEALSYIYNHTRAAVDGSFCHAADGIAQTP